jgi:hypothetical protein
MKFLNLKELKPMSVITLFFLALFVILVIVIIGTAQVTGQNHEQGQKSNNSMNENAPSSTIITAQEESCNDCHDEFVPFEVALQVPGNIQAGEEFDYELLISNPDSEIPHTVENLEARLTGLGETNIEPYYDQFSGSVRRFQTIGHNFPVQESASSATISLTGDSGLLGRNNLDLLLRSPDGETWRATSAGINEEIHLSQQDIINGGYGQYSIDVQFVNGLGPISYSISITVDYSSGEMTKLGKNLDTDETYAFSWSLTLSDDQIEALGSEVSGTVTHNHHDGETTSYRYTFEITHDYQNKDKNTLQSSLFLDQGRTIGFLSAGILIPIILLGFSEPSKIKIAKYLKIKDPQNVHCYLSLTIILFGLIHAALLIIGPYSWDSEPNLFGAIAILIFGTISVTGFGKKQISLKIGTKNWKRLHILATLLVVLIILYHAVTFGGHFS